MIDLLERAAAASPGQVAVRTPEGSATYADLLDGARRVAAALRARGLTRIAVVEPDVGHVLRLLAGAALAGVEPCQYQADIAPHELAAQAASLDHRTVVSRRTDLDGGPEVLTPEALLAGEPDARPAGDGPQPLVIRTTGTTGLPKAARHDWRRLGRTVAAVRPRPDQRWLMAYGPHQFAGIQVLQHVLAAQATLVAPFPRQPADGLAALLADGVTCVSATPTYWRFLLAEARSRRAALPALEQITLGGEASPDDLLADLRAAFPTARISHVYASTEFGSVASVNDGRAGFAVDALHSAANPAANLKVEDGQLWVRPAAGMLGYAGDEQAATGDWQPTGDLVRVDGDRVVFQGRSSEVINVGGVKVHPLPVESRITALPGVALARVHGRPNALTGAIVAAEIVPAGTPTEAELNQLRRDVKAAVGDLPPAWQPRSVKFVEAIETRGEKTVRGMEEQ